MSVVMLAETQEGASRLSPESLGHKTEYDLYLSTTVSRTRCREASERLRGSTWLGNTLSRLVRRDGRDGTPRREAVWASQRSPEPIAV
jgi:hypothetical protein